MVIRVGDMIEFPETFMGIRLYHPPDFYYMKTCENSIISPLNRSLDYITPNYPWSQSLQCSTESVHIGRISPVFRLKSDTISSFSQRVDSVTERDSMTE